MRYMMFVCTDTAPDTDKADEPDIDVWVAQNDARGRHGLGNVLAPTTVEAIEVARAHPMARGGRIEPRPFADLDD